LTLRLEGEATWELKAVLRVFKLDGAPFCDPMDLFWHINPVEMLSDLMVTTFLILLAASVVVVASMFMFPLIDLAFKKKGKTAPKDTEPRHHDGLTAYHAPRQLSGAPWLALRSDFSRPDAVVHSQLTSDPNAQRAAPDPLKRMAHDALAHHPLERITSIINRSLAPKRAETLRFAGGGGGQPDGLEALGKAGRFTPIFFAAAQDQSPINNRQPIANDRVAEQLKR
jgi:hypothetical protein